MTCGLGDVNERWLRLLVLVIGPGTVQPSVAENDSVCCEHQPLELGDGGAGVARQLPGEMLCATKRLAFAAAAATTSSSTSRTPITPLAPATKTRISAV